MIFYQNSPFKVRISTTLSKVLIPKIAFDVLRVVKKYQLMNLFV